LGQLGSQVLSPSFLQRKVNAIQSATTVFQGIASCLLLLANAFKDSLEVENTFAQFVLMRLMLAYPLLQFSPNILLAGQIRRIV